MPDEKARCPLCSRLVRDEPSIWIKLFVGVLFIYGLGEAVMNLIKLM